MSKATDTLRFLAIHNSWRRGDETFGMQDPAEIGAAIDDAVNLLRRYDELERENIALREALKNAIMLLRRWNKNDVTDDVVIETRKAIHAALKETQT